MLIKNDKKRTEYVFTCTKDTGANHTGTTSTFMAYLFHPILPPTDVSNNHQTASVTELKVPLSQADSSQNLDVTFAVVIRVVLSGYNHDSPVIIKEQRQKICSCGCGLTNNLSQYANMPHLSFES